jgi:hypothetical protein
MTTSETAAPAPASPRYKRKLRNYLIDVGLQIRYTAFIIVIAVLLTGVLGYFIYGAITETSQIILMNGIVDPANQGELEAQLRSNDRKVLLLLVLSGVLVIVSIAAAGIWITHKVAGPLYSIANICVRVRDNRLAPSLRQQLRKGDELQDFYSTFRDMYEALRARADSDVKILGEAIALLENAGTRSAAADETLAQLRRLRKEKGDSLDPNAGPPN